MCDRVVEMRLVSFNTTSLTVFPTQVCLNSSCPQCKSLSVGVAWCTIEDTVTPHFCIFSVDIMYSLYILEYKG